MTKPDSPPPTPPSEPSSHMFSLSLQTPPRRPSLSTSRIEFQTPSPPRNFPALPGPPSSEDDTDHDIDDDRTPINRTSDNNFLGNLTAMKTPKPPGAWMATPQPIPKEPPPRPSSTPPERTPPPSDQTFLTPGPSSLSRASTMPTQTPAPPGGWINTPGGSLKRKNLLKVRFDVEPGDLSSDSMASLPMVGPADLKPLNGLDIKSMRSAADDSDVKLNGFAAPSAQVVQSPKEITPVEREPTPPLPQPTVSRPIRAPGAPSVRVVDAFGRETKLDEPPPVIPIAEEEPVSVDWKASRHQASDAQHAPTTSSSRNSKGKSTERNRSIVRFVDSMGREIIEGEEEAPTKKLKRKSSSSKKKRHAPPAEDLSEEFIPPTSHNEALARVRETIAHLAEDLDEVDR